MHGEDAVHVEPVREVLVAGARRVLAATSFTPCLKQMVDDAITILHQANIPPAGPPIVRTCPLDNDMVEVNVGFVVNGKEPAASFVPSFSLPGGEVASTWHLGPRETIREAYGRLERWLVARERDPAATRPWEVLWAGWGGSSAPDKRSRIQVVWPLGRD